MNYIVFDLEWNQPRTKSEKITDPIPFSGEIIQIGAVKMDEAFQITDTFEIMVTPIYYTTMNSAVEQLTGIDDEDLKEGVPFVEAYQAFLRFCGEEFCFLTWGGDDIRILTANLKIHHVSTENFPKCYNLQRIFGKQIAKTKKQIALEKAVELLGEPPYRAHNALNDAMSSALVSKHLDLTQEALHADVPAPKKKRRPPFSKRRAKLACGTTVASAKDALPHVESAGFVCACGRKKSAPLGWIRLGKAKVITAVTCPCGKEYYAWVRWKQTPQNEIHLDIHVEKMNQELRALYHKNNKIDDAIREYAQLRKARKGEERR